MNHEIKCPRCGQKSLFSPQNPFRPFCSERCKTIDLGNWAMGKYAVPVAAVENPDQILDQDDENPKEIRDGDASENDEEM